MRGCPHPSACGGRVAVACAGDSRAVLCEITPASTVSAIDLSNDHNVESNPAEVARAEAAGGGRCGKYMAVNGADGMPQVTRSLGDVAHHYGDVLTACPEISITRLEKDSHAFIFIASDGVWHHFDSKTVVEKIHAKLVAEEYIENQPDSPAKLLKVLSTFRDEIIDLVRTNTALKDDISMVLFPIKGHWR